MTGPFTNNVRVLPVPPVGCGCASCREFAYRVVTVPVQQERDAA